jgi:hypothetical protein
MKQWDSATEKHYLIKKVNEKNIYLLYEIRWIPLKLGSLYMFLQPIIFPLFIRRNKRQVTSMTDTLPLNNILIIQSIE